MERLPRDFTQDLYGKTMLIDFKSAYKEFEIEDFYKNYYSYTSIFKIRTIKRGFSDSDCATDGLLEFNYRGEWFYGLQETKFKKAFTDLQLKYQLVQSLMYEWMFDMRKEGYNIKVHILNSEKYFAYIYEDEIVELKRKLWNIFPVVPETPSGVYSNPLVNKLLKETTISFHRENLTDKFELHKVIRNIFKHCLK